MHIFGRPGHGRSRVPTSPRSEEEPGSSTHAGLIDQARAGSCALGPPQGCALLLPIAVLFDAATFLPGVRGNEAGRPADWQGGSRAPSAASRVPGHGRLDSLRGSVPPRPAPCAGSSVTGGTWIARVQQEWQPRSRRGAGQRKRQRGSPSSSMAIT